MKKRYERVVRIRRSVYSRSRIRGGNVWRTFFLSNVLCVSMILPQVHLRKPCYDFSFLEMFRFKQLGASRSEACATSQAPSENFIGTFIGRSDGRCVQRAGTYSMRVDDSRLQGIPRCTTNNCNRRSLARREFQRLAYTLSGQLVCSLHASV